MLQDLAPMLIGMDPLQHEVIWNKLYQDGLNCDIVTDAHLMLVYDYIIMNMLERTEAR